MIILVNPPVLKRGFKRDLPTAKKKTGKRSYAELEVWAKKFPRPASPRREKTRPAPHLSQAKYLKILFRRSAPE